MNDDQFEGLDDRAKTAASSVQAAAQRRPRPSFDADRPMTLPEPAAVGQSRAPRRTAWVAAAAVVALVAGAVTFAVTRPDKGNDTVTAAAVEDPRPYVVEDLPDGLEQMMFVDLIARPNADPPASPMPVFGKTLEEPLAAATVIDAVSFEELEFTATEVDEETIYRNDGYQFLPGQWVGVKRDGAFILIAGATEDDALMLAQIVSAKDGAVTVDVEALPDGWRRLTTMNDPLDLAFMAVRSNLTGYLGSYASEDTETAVSVLAEGGDEAGMWSGRLFVDDSHEVTVRGHQGFIGSFSVPDGNADGTETTMRTMRSLAWIERPGEVIRMTGISMSEEELLAVAEGIRPAGEQEWRDLVEKTQLGDLGGYPGSSDAKGRTTGTFDDGTKWSLSVVESPSYEGLPDGGTVAGDLYTELRVAVETDTTSGSHGSSSSSNGGEKGFKSVDTTELERRRFASGILTDDTQRVQVQSVDGSVLSEATIVSVAGYRAFAAELDETPTVIVALGTDGSEVGRVTFEEVDGSLSVDMGGHGVGQSTTSGEDDSSYETHDSGGAGGEITTFQGQGTPVDGEGNPIPEPVQPTPTTKPGGG